MNIAFDINTILNKKTEGSYYVVVKELLRHFTNTNSASQFVFLFKNKIDDSLVFSKHINTAIIKPGGDNKLARWYRQSTVIPAAIKKYKIDFLITGDLNTSNIIVPQLIITDGEQKIDLHKKCKSGNIICFSKAIVRKPSYAGYISYIPLPAPDFFKPLRWQEKEAVKIDYANNKEYFLVYGNAGNKEMLTVLKAFSKFKNRQHSSINLIIITAENGKTNWEKLLQNYKYRNDVQLIEKPGNDLLAKLIASAYSAILYTPHYAYNDIQTAVLQCGIPIIAEEKYLQETEAGISADMNDADSISKAMINLYTNEMKREEIIKKGMDYVAQISIENSAEMLRQTVLKTI